MTSSRLGMHCGTAVIGVAKVKGTTSVAFRSALGFWPLQYRITYKNSAVVVVGVATTALPIGLTAEGQTHRHRYEIAVRETIKGIIAGDKIKVSLPGGEWSSRMARVLN